MNELAIEILKKELVREEGKMEHQKNEARCYQIRIDLAVQQEVIVKKAIASLKKSIKILEAA